MEINSSRQTKSDGKARRDYFAPAVEGASPVGAASYGFQLVSDSFYFSDSDHEKHSINFGEQWVENGIHGVVNGLSQASR